VFGNKIKNLKIDVKKLTISKIYLKLINIVTVDNKVWCLIIK